MTVLLFESQSSHLVLYLTLPQGPLLLYYLGHPNYIIELIRD